MMDTKLTLESLLQLLANMIKLKRVFDFNTLSAYL